MYDNCPEQNKPTTNNVLSAIPCSVNLALVKLCIRVFNKVLSREQKLWSRQSRKRLVITAWVSKGVQWSAPNTPPRKYILTPGPHRMHSQLSRAKVKNYSV